MKFSIRQLECMIFSICQIVRMNSAIRQLVHMTFAIHRLPRMAFSIRQLVHMIVQFISSYALFLSIPRIFFQSVSSSA